MSSRRASTIESMAVSLHRLSISPTVPISAPKRKERSHNGLASDSRESLVLMALSRIVASRETMILQASATTSMGLAFTASLQDVVLRVAVSSGNTALNEASIRSLFSLSGSQVAKQRPYEETAFLASKLPHEKAKALVVALLDTLTSVRTTDAGFKVSQRLLLVPQPAYNSDMASVLAELMSVVENGLRERLDGAPSNSGSASGSTSAMPSPLTEAADVQAVEIPSGILAADTMTANARTVLQARLSRALQQAEVDRLAAVIAEALAIMNADRSTRQQLLEMPMTAALLTRSGATLWACVVATESYVVTNVESFRIFLLALVSDIEGVVLMSALNST